MIDKSLTIESLKVDSGYSWNETHTVGMSESQLRNYLFDEANECDCYDEFEVAYGIYREIVWRFPTLADGWIGLSKSAGKMGLEAESRLASAEALRLKNSHTSH